MRELARRLSLSPSLISQIERGNATPSVGTLYAITTELGLSLDELFSGGRSTDGGNSSSLDLRAPAQATDTTRSWSRPPAERTSGDGVKPQIAVVRADDRTSIQLDSGVRWQRLTPSADPTVDFLFVVYDVGGASCDEGVLIRHAGREYGHVLSGTLRVTVGFDEHLLGAGDSISFDSATPHRLAAAGHGPVHALWFVVGRAGDERPVR